MRIKSQREDIDSSYKLIKLEGSNLNIHPHQASVRIAVEIKPINEERERRRDEFNALRTIKVMREILVAVRLQLQLHYRTNTFLVSICFRHVDESEGSQQYKTSVYILY